jgi:hypothetical protein
MSYCGVTTQDGTPCENWVKRGGPCHIHRRLGSRPAPQAKRSAARTKTYRPRTTQPWSQTSRPAPTRPAPESARAQPQRPPTEAELRELRLREAVSYLADALDKGWADSVAQRVAKYVTRETWQRIRASWPRRRCRLLARLAQRILDVKNQLHETASETAEALTQLLGRSKVEGMFAAELAERIPLPWDTKLDTLAKSIRITGVMRCAAAGRNLRRCECFCDLTETESKEQVARLLLAAADNYWTTHYQPPAIPPNPPA